MTMGNDNQLAPLERGVVPDAEALAHRIAWRYKKSTDPAHSDTYTFNRTTLLQFVAALVGAERERQANDCTHAPGLVAAGKGREDCHE